MKVYFRAPAWNPVKPRELIFPNPEDVPACGYTGDRYDLRASDLETLGRFKILRGDLLNLAVHTHEYLEALPVEGKAIIYYRHQEVLLKSVARKAERDSWNRYHLYPFGVATATDEGESGFNLLVRNGWQIGVETLLNGISTRVLRDVVVPFSWESRVRVIGDACRSEWGGSEFDRIVKKYFEPEWGWGRTERAFDIPYDEYATRFNFLH